MYQKDPCEGEAYGCAAIPIPDQLPVILERTRRSFWGGHPGHFAADEAVILNRTDRSYWSGLRTRAHLSNLLPLEATSGMGQRWATWASNSGLRPKDLRVFFGRGKKMNA